MVKISLRVNLSDLRDSLNLIFSFKTTFSKIHSEPYKALFKRNIEDQDMQVYKTFIVLFDKELIKKKYEKQKPNMVSQSEAPAPEEIVVRKHQRDTDYYTYSLYSSTGETGLTVGTRVNMTPEKRIPKKKKNIKYKALSPFLPGNKRLLNKDNDDNPETTDTSLSEKYDMSHTSTDDFTGKTDDKTITNNDDEYKEETSKI